MLIGTWLWQARSEAATRPVVDYSAFYAWVEAGKVSTVVMKGDHTLEVTLKAPEFVQGTRTKSFQSLRPEGDDALPLLRHQHVELRVTRDEQPLLVQALLGSLPWLILIGGGMWLSRRAQRMVTGRGYPVLSRVRCAGSKRARA